MAAALRDLTTLSLLFLLNEATIKAFGATQTVTRRHSESTTGIDCFTSTSRQDLKHQLWPRSNSTSTTLRFSQPDFFPIRLVFVFVARQKDKFPANYS